MPSDTDDSVSEVFYIIGNFVPIIISVNTLEWRRT